MRLLALLFVCAAAHAQTYPSKPVRIIVPVAAGGNQEITIRAVADEMSKSLGQPLVIEAKPSASALITSVAACDPELPPLDMIKGTNNANTTARFISSSK